MGLFPVARPNLWVADAAAIKVRLQIAYLHFQTVNAAYTHGFSGYGLVTPVPQTTLPVQHSDLFRREYRCLGRRGMETLSQDSRSRILGGTYHHLIVSWPKLNEHHDRVNPNMDVSMPRLLN